jgi:hypothetical protein
MESQLPQLLSALIGIFIGSIAIWLILRGQIGAALERGKADVQVELATGRERLRCTVNNGHSCFKPPVAAC